MSATELLIGLWFGSLGAAYMLYGRKQGAPIPLACGLLLMVEPYIVKGSVPQVLVGLILAVLPFIRR